ncbi:PHB depolymerase family esterase [Mitsuaria sp. GD03876]|uniref:extracellular catalytic domain type 1 short-chain-length polyhydroxyalkanoate depolymerase n=1 Tax=Mitsuaria sp. GD03876 TaxID=2975399 RepID=UPI002447FB94|nr:PHB depolymerase family esterase [Mitsuaria sp. GD03876]MDH0865424.1 PHB depolymerase family esterase [Mitsuaria sp. GD03876]
MPKRSSSAALRKAWQQGLRAVTGQVLRATRDATKAATTAATKAARQAGVHDAVPGLQKTPPHPSPGLGDWIAGVATGRTGMRRYRLFRPAGLPAGERAPLLVMLHGCGQDAAGFARSTRMNRLAAREGFLVLYPEQSRLANPQRCWNWFDTETGRAQGEAALILAAIDQVCLLYPADRERVGIAGLSAGAGMAALLATSHPTRFRAVAMHSGVPPGLASSATTALRAMRGKAASPELAPPADGAAWPPLLVVQGTEDRIVAASNAAEAVRQWSLAAGATTRRARTVQRGRRWPMEVVEFKRGRAIAATLVAIEGLGHAWSGGAAKQPFSDPQGPDASTMIWRFIAKQCR